MRGVRDREWLTGVAPAQRLLPVEAGGRRASRQQRRRESAGKDGSQQHVLRQFARGRHRRRRRQSVPSQLRREPVPTGGDQHYDARPAACRSRQTRGKKYAVHDFFYRATLWASAVYATEQGSDLGVGLSRLFGWTHSVSHFTFIIPCLVYAFYLSVLWIIGFWLFCMYVPMDILVFIVFHFINCTACCDLSSLIVLFGLPTTRL